MDRCIGSVWSECLVGVGVFVAWMGYRCLYAVLCH